MTFEALYNRLLKSSLAGNLTEELDLVQQQGYDPYHLSCLLNPEKHPVVIRTDACTCEGTKLEQCRARCYFDALFIKDGSVSVDPALCVGCGDCVRNCDDKKLTESRDILPTLNALRTAQAPVYAMIAPAFINQYSAAVTPGKLRAAFKQIGFTGMLEVALFADILTLKEALEFDKNIQSEKDYQLTSCCCPMWIAMIKKVYAQLIPHVPAAVSPMVACGRSIKKIHPGAITVFIGPCIAKKAEARETDIADSTDFVLTFQEIQDVFDYAGIDPASMEEDERDHSSRAGRIYASTGGVSQAVRSTVARINPDKPITVKTRHADGVPACKQMLNDIMEGNGGANIFEGMGCVGGCVGGPKALIPREQGRENVVRYGAEASYETPIDNPYVVALLHQLGLDTIESLLEHSDIFIRKL